MVGRVEVALGLTVTLTHSDDGHRVWQESNRALAEASSIEDAEIEAKDATEAALELVHVAVLMEQHLIIYLSFSKSEGRDQMRPVGKPRFISQTQVRVGTTQEDTLLMARLPSLMESLWHKVFLLALNKPPVFNVSCPEMFKASQSAKSGPGSQGQDMGVQGKGEEFGQRSPETHVV